jgi:ABC-2 type transport system ATP-binding protein
MAPTIVATDLSKAYRTYKKRSGLVGALQGLVHRDFEETRAVDRVSFSIEQGEFVGFLGPNGAGKTTVLKMLSGLLVPTSGAASVLGYTPWDRKPEFKRQFSLVLGQKNSLWWDLPARESLELNRAIYQIPRTTYQKTVDELVELLDVRDKLNVMVRELSLGERMKMELISAFLHQPKILFLDEPTIGLDVVSQKNVREFLRHHSEERKTSTILTSHYMQDIAELCQRVLIIDHGRVFFDGELSEIIEQFSGHKYLQFTFRTPTPYQPSWGEIVSQSGASITLKVLREKVTDICQDILATGNVQDFSVEEEPIEDIIREIFERQHARVASGAGQTPIEVAGRK